MLNYGYIDHEFDQPLFKTLDRMALSLSVESVVGGSGVEKERLLHEWAQHRISPYESHQVLMMTLPPPPSNAGKTDRLADPMTLKVFTSLWYRLKARGVQKYVDRGPYIDEDRAQWWTERHFLTLRNNVRVGLHDQMTRVIVINDAQNLSNTAWNELITLRRELQHLLGIILVGDMDVNAEPDEALGKFWKMIPGTSYTKYKPLLIRALTKEEFLDTLTDMVIQLNADVAVEKAVMDAFTDILWNQTTGNWHAIDEYYRVFDEVLGREGEAKRMITKATMNAILRELSGNVPLLQ